MQCIDESDARGCASSMRDNAKIGFTKDLQYVFYLLLTLWQARLYKIQAEFLIVCIYVCEFVV